VKSLLFVGFMLLSGTCLADALSDADAYIAANRRGQVTINLSGLGLPTGAPVSVSMQKLAFNFGTAIPGNSSSQVSAYLGSGGSAQQQNFQAKLLENFNAVTMENAGKWDNTENTRGQPSLAGVNTILDYADAHGLYKRFHNVFWDLTDGNPGWVNTLRTAAAGGNAAAKTDLRNAISARLAYLPLSRANEVDVYNESYQGQCCNGTNSYWNIFGASGIASIYNEAHALAPGSKMFMNEYDALAANASGYLQNIKALRNAGAAVGGIGLEDYEYAITAHNPTSIAADMANYAAQGLPQTITEFGAYSSVSTADAATIVRDTMRLAFGNPQGSGIFMWGFVAENGGGNLFAPSAALYAVNTSNWNNWTITASGKAWQDQLGIHDWDGNTANGWTTQLATATDSSGHISFNGYYGSYLITAGNKSYQLSIAKGTNDYWLGPLPGDFNADGKVDAADYVRWRKYDGTSAGYSLWRQNVGKLAQGASVPEGRISMFPSMVLLIWILIRSQKYRSHK
jgi:endo-1,4-beta-xylanase